MLTLGLVPWLVSIFGFHTTSALLRRLVGCSGTRDTDAFVLEISTVIAPAYGFLLWIYLPLLVATAVAELTNGLYSWIGTATARGFTVIFGCWITISVFGWVAIVCRERSGRLRRRDWSGFVLALSSLVLPALAWVGSLLLAHWSVNAL